MSRKKVPDVYFPEKFDINNIASFFYHNTPEHIPKDPAPTASGFMRATPYKDPPNALYYNRGVGNATGQMVSDLFNSNVLGGGTLDDIIDWVATEYVRRVPWGADGTEERVKANSLKTVREHLSGPKAGSYAAFTNTVDMWDYNVDNVRETFGDNPTAFFYYTADFLKQGRALGDELVLAPNAVIAKELLGAWDARVGAGADSRSMLKKQQDLLAEQQRNIAQGEALMREKEAASQARLRASQEAAAAAAERASKAKALADAARIRADNAKGLSSAVGINVSSSASSYLNRNAVMAKTAEEINRKEIAGVNIVQGDTESQGPGKQKRRALSSSLGINV